VRVPSTQAKTGPGYLLLDQYLNQSKQKISEAFSEAVRHSISFLSACWWMLSNVMVQNSRWLPRHATPS
jgi:hypothetical protein